jgi:glycogen debranching enzyme
MMNVNNGNAKLPAASETIRTGGTNDSGRFVGRALLGAALGVGATLTYQYFSKIFRQPRLASQAVLADVSEFDTQETRALFIAVENLHSGISERRLENRDHKQILHAGYRNFRESWARDFSFAVYGLLALKEYEPIRDTLEAFFAYQKPDGRLPVKLRSLDVVSRFFHSVFEREQPLEMPLTPKYITGHGSHSLDGQALLVNAAAQYIQETGDRAFAQENWDKLKLGMDWLTAHVYGGTHLLGQSAYADWADSVARKGIVFYTNVVYWKALQEMAVLAEYLGEGADTENYRQSGAIVGSELQEYLWRPASGYFAASTSMDNLSSAGNLLAITWGLADEQQANSILDRIRAFGMAIPVPTQAAFPPYRRSAISPENRLGGIGNYHTDAAWLWIGAWHIIALCKLGRIEEAQKLLTRAADVIVRDQQVHEVYAPNGQPLSSRFYTSEAPLMWNAGMMIHAFYVAEQYFQAV